jgi:molybdopterin-binding protein
MKHGARNDIPAIVTRIKEGAVMCQVEVKLKGTDYAMTSVMTMDSMQGMSLKVGDEVKVVAKAVNVLLMKG